MILKEKIRISFPPTLLDILLDTSRNKYVQIQSGPGVDINGFGREGDSFKCKDLESGEGIDYSIKDYDILELAEKRSVKEILSPELVKKVYRANEFVRFTGKIVKRTN